MNADAGEAVDRFESQHPFIYYTHTYFAFALADYFFVCVLANWVLSSDDGDDGTAVQWYYRN